MPDHDFASSPDPLGSVSGRKKFISFETVLANSNARFPKSSPRMEILGARQMKARRFPSIFSSQPGNGLLYYEAKVSESNCAGGELGARHLPAPSSKTNLFL